MFYSLFKLFIWKCHGLCLQGISTNKQSQWMRKHLVWMPVLQCCCAVLLLMWDPSPACFLIFTSWSHSVNWEEQLITCYAATDSTDKWQCAVLSFTATDRSYICLFCFLHFMKPQRQLRTSARALTLVNGRFFLPSLPQPTSSLHRGTIFSGTSAPCP